MADSCSTISLLILLALQLPVPACWKNNLITVLMKLSLYTDRHLMQGKTISMTTYLKNAVFYKRD